eukprot:COSAG01_NODE_3905_length_5559_cov_13.718498_8_plen_76_part_00
MLESHRGQATDTVAAHGKPLSLFHRLQNVRVHQLRVRRVLSGCLAAWLLCHTLWLRLLATGCLLPWGPLLPVIAL